VSKARLVITAVVMEGRSQADVARAYGVSKGWVSKLVARWRAEGDAACEPRSRRPRTSPRAIPDSTVGLIVELRRELTAQGLDAGADTIGWHLAHHHQLLVSKSTIDRTLHRQGLVVPAPAKRPRSSYIRFAAEQPNEMWQADFTHYRLATSIDVEILSWLDDHARHALSVTAHHRVTGPIVVDTFRHAVTSHGAPASTLTDNGMVFTTRLSGGIGGRNGFETELRRLGVAQKNSRPNHPTTCGKVERFQQTMKTWLRAQPHQPSTLDALQALLDVFVEIYNTRRPHRSLPQRSTPAVAYAARPKAAPGDRTTDTHYRVRHDRVDDGGSVTLRHHGDLHHIGIGRTHARTRVILLVADFDVRVIDAATGELYRHLTLDPARRYHGTGAPIGGPRRPYGPRKTKQTEP
jgi:transposase InsO family protein